MAPPFYLLGGQMDNDFKNEVSKGGRPSRQDLDNTSNMTKREQASALKEFRKRLLLNPRSPKLLEKMFDTAFDDEHKQQGLAMKLLADRLMPLAGFTADGKTNAQVSINISGLNDGVVIDGSTGTVENDDES